MGRLVSALERAASKQGRTFLLAGEAGIGKTRMAQEALTLARERGFLVLEGRAYPLEGRLAYSPILAAFGPLLRRFGPSHRARLVSGLPDLGRLFAELRLPVPELLGDPHLEKTRLFEAVARLLERIARETPVVLFFDDLHWADAASIELLHYLARGLADQAVLLLGTYRSEDTDSARGLLSLIGTLRRSGHHEELNLARLEPEAVACLAHSILDSEAPRELLDLLNVRAGGTPLFVTEIVAALIDAGGLVRGDGGWTLDPGAATVLPSTVRDLLLERLERLDPTERAVIESIAVGGDAVPHRVLRAVSVLNDDELLPALRRLRAGGLVAEQFAGTEVAYTLTHPLIEDVAYVELSAMAQRRSHAAYADALERLRPDDLDHLAHHVRLAGGEVDPTHALNVLLAAGDRAAALCANDQAARHFGAALTLIREGRRIDLLRVVLERLGEAWVRVGETAAAIAVWSEALTEYERIGDATAVARLRRRLALAEWDRGQFKVARSHLDAGLQALAEHQSSQDMADILLARVVILGRSGSIDEVSAAATELEALTERLGSTRATAEAHLAQIGPRMVRWDFAGAADVARLGLEAAELVEDALLTQRAHDQLALVAYSLGEHKLARHHAERSLDQARRLGAPPLELFPRNRLVSVDLMSGDWDDARRGSNEAVAMARRLEFSRGLAGALSLRALVHSHGGELDAAAACLAEAHEVFRGGSGNDRNIFSQVAAAEMVVALESGDVTSALAAVQQLGDLPAASGFPLMVLGLTAEAHLVAGEPERGLAIAHDLTARAPAGNAYATGLGSRIEGLAAELLQKPADALTCLERASRAYEAAAMPFEAARARLEWASLIETSDPASASAAARDSLEVFERLGARRYAGIARRLLYKLGVRPRGFARPHADGTPLSPREIEVIRLVVQDLTNSEIAERLVISPRTVTTHMSRIYAKLGFNSRTALVRYALDAGLHPD